MAMDQRNQRYHRALLFWLLPAVAVSLMIGLMRAWRWQLELRPLARLGYLDFAVIEPGAIFSMPRPD